MVPLQSRDFLVDQRKSREKIDRKIGFCSILDDIFRQKRKSGSKKSSTVNQSGKSTESISTIDDDSATNLRGRRIEKSIKIDHYNTVELCEVAKVADRYNVPDRVAAAICTAVLVDFGIVSTDDNLFVIDRNKVRRHRRKLRNIQVQELRHDDIHGLYFDGRKDTTKTYTDTTMKTIREEHISFVQEPDSLFIGHKSVEDGKADSIVSAIESLLNEKSIPVEQIKILGCDGPKVNTGEDGGVIRKIEIKWGRPVQWVICQLHMNELPLRALITKLDGGTKGPNTYSGPIGKRLTGCEDLPIVKFEPIPFTCPENLPDIAHTLSSDQKYLFEFCTALSKGQISDEMAKRSPGTLAMARWTVTANRILRLYVSTNTPSNNLKQMTKYVMNSYAPILFKIKHKSSIVFGPIHLFNMIESSRTLPADMIEVVQTCIQRNAFYAHPEHVVLAMTNDNDEDIRKMAWNRILNSRQALEMPQRKFKVPKINFNAADYKSMIDIPIVVEPPILRDVDVNSTNIDFLASKVILDHDFGGIIRNMPLHTQAVERCVKLVTEASKSVCGQESRDGHISNTLASRNTMSSFESKQDYTISENISNKLKL